MRFRNWAGTVETTPSAWHQPADEAEVAALVRAARTRITRVKVVGAGHSWSDIAATEDILVNLDRIAHVEASDLRVRAGAGLRLRDLNRALAERGLAMPILGSIAEQSIAGAIATGTHGSSLVHGNLATTVVAARVVVGSGEVLVLEGQDPRLAAVRVGLGALGILTEVTLQCVPAFRLREESGPMDWAHAVANGEEIARSSEYVKLWWLPHTEQVQVFRCARTDGPGEPSRFARWFDEAVVNRRLFAALLRLGARLPHRVPAFNRLVAALYFRPRTQVGRSDHVLNIAMPPVHREMEYAVPLERAGALLRRMRADIEREGLRVNFVVEVRFVRADDAWMSPAHGRETCQVGAYMAECGDLERYFAGFEAAALELGGRPHWGKEFGDVDIEALYPMAARFRALAAELDPDGVFRNERLDRILGPVATREAG